MAKNQLDSNDEPGYYFCKWASCSKPVVRLWDGKQLWVAPGTKAKMEGLAFFQGPLVVHGTGENIGARYKAREPKVTTEEPNQC